MGYNLRKHNLHVGETLFCGKTLLVLPNVSILCSCSNISRNPDFCCCLSCFSFGHCLWFTDSDYPFDICILFLLPINNRFILERLAIFILYVILRWSITLENYLLSVEAFLNKDIRCLIHLIYFMYFSKQEIPSKTDIILKKQ